MVPTNAAQSSSHNTGHGHNTTVATMATMDMAELAKGMIAQRQETGWQRAIDDSLLITGRNLIRLLAASSKSLIASTQVFWSQWRITTSPRRCLNCHGIL